MMRQYYACLALLASLAQGPVLAKTYTIKKGDTLSRVAGREYGRPILGPKGSLQKVLQKNPEIKNPDRIYPKQIIRLGDEVDEQVAENAKRPAPSVPVSESSQTIVSAPSSEAPLPVEASPACFGIRLGLGLSREQLEAVDHEHDFSSTLDSETQPTFDLDAYYKHGDSLRLGVSLGIKGGDFQDSNDERFQGQKHSLSRLSVFGEMTFEDRWHLGLELGSEKSFFFKQTGITTFGLEDAFVDFVTVTARIDLIAQNSWRWSLGAQTGLHARGRASGQEIGQGSSYAVNTGLSYRWTDAYSLEGTLQYGRHRQGIDGIRQSMAERTAEIALRYEF